MAADCKVTGCEGRCENDSCDSGTTNDGKTVKAKSKINFDSPILEEHDESTYYSNIVKRFFYDIETISVN